MSVATRTNESARLQWKLRLLGRPRGGQCVDGVWDNVCCSFFFCWTPHVPTYPVRLQCLFARLRTLNLLQQRGIYVISVRSWLAPMILGSGYILKNRFMS